MYNNPTAKQLAHLIRKKQSGIVYQFGNTDMKIPMTYYKAHLPMLVAPTNPQSLWEELGFTWSTTNRKADVVVCGDVMGDLDINKRIKDMWAKCKVNGLIVITCSSAISDSYVSVQPNYWVEFAEKNDIELGITYFSLGDFRGQHQVALDSSERYKISELRDSLHKFVETREIITNITLVKLSTKELVCP